jgi:hypothetical protein
LKLVKPITKGAGDGETTITPQGIKDHPLLRHELNTQAFIARTLSRLLPSAPKKPVGRPASINNWLGPNAK